MTVLENAPSDDADGLVALAILIGGDSVGHAVFTGPLQTLKTIAALIDEHLAECDGPSTIGFLAKPADEGTLQCAKCNVIVLKDKDLAGGGH